MTRTTADDPLPGDADIAALGSVLAEPARARILLALGDGRALPASVLAAEAGVAPSTASTHLARLLAAGLLVVRPQGRHRYYALAGPQVGELIEVLARLAPAAPVRSLREGTRAHALRRARTCYDHLAGRLGVALFGALVEQDLVTGGSGRHDPARAREDRLSGRGRDLHYRLTPAGHRRLSALDVALPAADGAGEVALSYCVDWTEQAHHLSGAVGRALTQRLFDLGWLERIARTRGVRLSDGGERGLVEHFALRLAEA
ncbi:MAG TPA: helix-turn-helix transcriptional regulator [Solirubrobacteraceae bacterium]|jgi:DNA-binding transcriptional ArsR family regulator